MIRRVLLIGLAVVVVAGVGAGAKVAAASRHPEPDPTTGVEATDVIVRGDLQAVTTVSGTLQYAGKLTVQATTAGVVAAVPAAGTVVKPGQRLYAVDDVPVFLLRGAIPAWRDLAYGMSDGPDVRQLEQNLRALGYFDRDPDQHFTGRTADAIRAWQKAEGLDRTGRLPLGSVIFTSGDLRIGTPTAHLGDRVAPGSPIVDTTGTTRIVEADVKLADQKAAVKGAKVGVLMPDGRQATGTIASVGIPAQKNDSTVVPVTVTLADQAAAGSFQQASVTVTIPSENRRNVLSVPVGALLAVDPQHFGVEIADPDGTTRVTPVAVGLFAGGRVEISGAGLAAGQRVVVPRR